MGREGCNRRSEVSLFSSSRQLKLNKSWASSPTLNGFLFSFPLSVLFPLCPHPHRKAAQVSGISRQIIIGSWSKGLKYFLHFCVSYTAREMELGGESERGVRCAASLQNGGSYCSGAHWPQGSHRSQCWTLTLPTFFSQCWSRTAKFWQGLMQLLTLPSWGPHLEVCARAVEQKLKGGLPALVVCWIFVSVSSLPVTWSPSY